MTDKTNYGAETARLLEAILAELVAMREELARLRALAEGASA